MGGSTALDGMIIRILPSLIDTNPMVHHRGLRGSNTLDLSREQSSLRIFLLELPRKTSYR